MKKQNKYDKLFLDIAIKISEMSHANRKKVGAIIVKNGNIISMGWNGTPYGFNNKCEDKNNNTISEVIHAEANAICKLSKYNGDCDGATLYITLSGCYDCSKLIIQSGIKRVIYLEEYRDKVPIYFLKKAGIICQKFCL